MPKQRLIIEWRFSALFAGLLIFLLGYPYTEGYEYAQGLLSLLTFLVLVMGCLAVSDSKRSVAGAVLLSALALANAVGNLLFHEPLLDLGGNILIVPFYVLMIARITRNILHPTGVNAQMLFAGLSVYLLLGFTFSHLYSAAYAVDIASFSYSAQAYPDGLSWYDFLYFSFVTLTTLGYGDIAPVDATARGLSIVQAICGVIFLATMIGELVGVAVHSRTSRL